MADIIGLGHVCVDLLGIVPRIPGPDEAIGMLETSRQMGGGVATAVVAIGRLGGSVEFIGGIGDDELGRFLLEIFRRAGVETSRVQVFKGRGTAYSTILVEKGTGKRTIISWFGSYVRDLSLPVPDLSGVRFLHLDGRWGDTAVAAARMAREKGVVVTLDAGAGNKEPRMGELLTLSHVAIPAFPFAQEFTGCNDPVEAARRILRMGPEVVTVTLGDRGSVTVTRQETFETPAFKVQVVDTTGAGDTFHGAYVYALNRGFDLRTTVKFASAVAALKCTKLGGQAGLPTLPEVEAFMAEYDAKGEKALSLAGGQL